VPAAQTESTTVTGIEGQCPGPWTGCSTPGQSTTNTFVLDCGVFTPDIIETWIDYKRSTELDPIRLRPHPHEFELYFDIWQNAGA
jgi:hypothetical protein